jgi:dTMP kinase
MTKADIAPGTFIVIEGIDGAGSSTQAQLLVDWLNARGMRCVLTAEPTRGPIGSLLRQVLAGRLVGRKPDGSQALVSNDVIALLFAADRIDHLDNEVAPWLAAGAQVVSDRYYHSSLLYQSLEGDLEWIRTLNAHARVPDVTYVLDLEADVAAGRRRQRSFEELYEQDALQRKLVAGYRRLPALLPGEAIVMIEGDKDAQSVHQAILSDLHKRFSWS